MSNSETLKNSKTHCLGHRADTLIITSALNFMVTEKLYRWHRLESSSFEEHHHFTVRGVWEKVNGHGFYRDEGLGDGHRLGSVPCQTGRAHVSPSSVSLIPFLDLLRRGRAKLYGICH